MRSSSPSTSPLSQMAQEDLPSGIVTATQCMYASLLIPLVTAFTAVLVKQ